jgi:hypothetical protein
MSTVYKLYPLFVWLYLLCAAFPVSDVFPDSVVVSAVCGVPVYQLYSLLYLLCAAFPVSLYPVIVWLYLLGPLYLLYPQSS